MNAVYGREFQSGLRKRGRRRRKRAAPTIDAGAALSNYLR